MKFHIEHERNATLYNIKGEPVNIEDKYRIYFRKWFKKRYVTFQGYCGNLPTPSISSEPDKITDVVFSITDRFHARWYLKQEAEYILKDIDINPNKYISCANISK